MMHRDKRIGKSLYRVVARQGGYTIREFYNDGGSTFAVGMCKTIYTTVDEALQELNTIHCERYFTDPSKLGVTI